MTTAPPELFDRVLYLARRAKASQDVSALLDQRLIEELDDRLGIISRSFDRALLIAVDPPGLSEALARIGKIGTLEIIGPSPADDLMLAENIYDAVISLLDLQTVNDVPGYLIQLARALKPDGLLLLALFAGDTLVELRDSWLAAEDELTGGATPRVAPMIGIRELGGLLQRAGLALPVADLDRIILRYTDAFALMQEIKALGFANPLADRARTLTSRRLLLKSAEHYARLHADPDGRIRATVEIAWANAWKPDPSQPKPLRPGSARMRLADALKAAEDKRP